MIESATTRKDILIIPIEKYSKPERPSDYIDQQSRYKWTCSGREVEQIIKHSYNKSIDSGRVKVYDLPIFDHKQIIKIQKTMQKQIERRESLDAFERIRPQDLVLSCAEIFIGGGMIIGGIFTIPTLAIIGFGSVFLGFLHLAWASKPKVEKK